MRILHILDGRCNPEGANGVERFVYALARESAFRGHTVRLLQVTDRAGIEARGVAIASFRPSAVPFKPPRGLFRSIQEFDPAIVHLHSVFSPVNYGVARGLHVRGIPYVLTPHGGLSPFLVGRSGFLKRAYGRVFESWIVAHAAFIHAMGDQDDLSRFRHHPPVVVIPNGVDLPGIGPHSGAPHLPGELRHAAGKKMFLYLGRIASRQKGLDLLIAAFAKARPKGWVLVITGPDPGGEVSKLRRLAMRCGIGDSVLFHGAVFGEPKSQLLASATVFVHPSRWEGLPSAVLEAAAMALPCLLTPAADPLGLLGREHGAITVSAVEAELASGLAALADQSQAELRRLGERGRDVVANQFTWGGITSQMLDAYRQYA